MNNRYHRITVHNINTNKKHFDYFYKDEKMAEKMFIDMSTLLRDSLEETNKLGGEITDKVSFEVETFNDNDIGVKISNNDKPIFKLLICKNIDIVDEQICDFIETFQECNF